MAKVGCPLKYDPEYHPKAVEELASEGKILTEIAKEFQIHVCTIHDWRERFPEFSDALTKGRDRADALVVDSLYKRAMGYEITEEKPMNIDGDVQIVRVEKHIPSDPASMFFWLKNRRPKEWRDKRETELSGPEGSPIKTEVTLDLTQKLSKYKDLFNDESDQQ